MPNASSGSDLLYSKRQRLSTSPHAWGYSSASSLTEHQSAPNGPLNRPTPGDQPPAAQPQPHDAAAFGSSNLLPDQQQSPQQSEQATGQPVMHGQPFDGSMSHSEEAGGTQCSLHQQSPDAEKPHDQPGLAVLPVVTPQSQWQGHFQGIAADVPSQASHQASRSNACITALSGPSAADDKPAASSMQPTPISANALLSTEPHHSGNPIQAWTGLFHNQLVKAGLSILQPGHCLPTPSIAGRHVSPQLGADAVPGIPPPISQIDKRSFDRTDSPMSGRCQPMLLSRRGRPKIRRTSGPLAANPGCRAPSHHPGRSSTPEAISNAEDCWPVSGGTPSSHQSSQHEQELAFTQPSIDNVETPHGCRDAQSEQPSELDEAGPSLSAVISIGKEQQHASPSTEPEAEVSSRVEASAVFPTILCPSLHASPTGPALPAFPADSGALAGRLSEGIHDTASDKNTATRLMALGQTQWSWLLSSHQATAACRIPDLDAQCCV